MWWVLSFPVCAENQSHNSMCVSVCVCVYNADKDPGFKKHCPSPSCGHPHYVTNMMSPLFTVADQPAESAKPKVRAWACMDGVCVL